MVKFRIRREVVTSGFRKFDGCLQSCWGWKSSSINLTKDLPLSPREGVDLLGKFYLSRLSLLRASVQPNCRPAHDVERLNLRGPHYVDGRIMEIMNARQLVWLSYDPDASNAPNQKSGTNIGATGKVWSLSPLQTTVEACPVSCWHILKALKARAPGIPSTPEKMGWRKLQYLSRGHVLLRDSQTKKWMAYWTDHKNDPKSGQKVRKVGVKVMKQAKFAYGQF